VLEYPPASTARSGVLEYPYYHPSPPYAVRHMHRTGVPSARAWYRHRTASERTHAHTPGGVRACTHARARVRRSQLLSLEDAARGFKAVHATTKARSHEPATSACTTRQTEASRRGVLFGARSARRCTCSRVCTTRSATPTRATLRQAERRPPGVCVGAACLCHSLPVPARAGVRECISAGRWAGSSIGTRAACMQRLRLPLPCHAPLVFRGPLGRILPGVTAGRSHGCAIG
jgi:hypothetical protein